MKDEKIRIGVYICECGPNIKEAMDVNEIAEFIRGFENVVLTKPFHLLCSEEGKTLIEKDIKEYQLTNIVLAACSPKEHEITFRKVLRNAGLNPFLLQIANIREQCAWVIKDKALATQKAKAMIAAAVKRVAYHEPLETKEIQCHSDVLVVGAGVAGISAALTLAQKNRKVYLVEKLPCIGGKVARYEKVFPSLECASCVLDPLLDEVLHNEHIELIAFSEIEEVLGFYGNFIVKVRKKARFVDSTTCIGCGACSEVCPVKIKNEYNEGLDNRKAIYIPYPGALPHVAVIDGKHCLHLQGKECNACQDACPFGSIRYEDTDQIQELEVGAIVLATGFDVFDPKKVSRYGYGKIKNVYTSLEFERLLNSTGPTEGKILLKNGQPPKRIGLIHCVGSRTKKYHEYCSGICCMYSLKFSHLIKEQLPDSSITEFYSDFCLPGRESQSFFKKLADKKGVNFIQVKNIDSVELKKKDNTILVKYRDINGKIKGRSFDLVILSVALEAARNARELAEIFDISQDKDGFFLEEHTNIAPVSTSVGGIFIAGCAHGPKDIQGAVAEGQAAAGRILSKLIPGEKLSLEPITAEVDEDLCSGCKTCISLCPYKALTYDQKKKTVSVNEVLCRGCGICVATCPGAAIKARHFTDKQIVAEIKGLLQR
ncbi:MAG TPA: CoB--CoM heterodisulfide reductase iron-sulfur subunit A family protein [Thermodesulfovibrionales bacterium]|nr:CoB--CoM heterodisulfide reductase iron-sulfur subunit A family protein [Thermodesulfovibrionales bacterium]